MSKLEMLTPQNSAIALIDYQPAMYQGVQSHDRIVPFHNVQILAKAAKLFKGVRDERQDAANKKAKQKLRRVRFLSVRRISPPLVFIFKETLA